MSWVEEVLRKYNLSGEYRKQRAVVIWQKIVGNNVAAFTEAKGYTNGTLVVAVSSSTAAHELSFLKGQYIEKLNANLGEKAVSDIRFVPGNPAAKKARREYDLSEAERESAAKLFAHLGDTDLRNSFERLYLTLRRREKCMLAIGARRCSACGVVFYGSGDICPGCRFGGVEDVEESD